MERRYSKWLTVAAALCFAVPELAFGQALQVFVFGDAAVVGQTGKASASGTRPGTSLSLNSGPWQASRLGFRGRFKISEDFEAWYDAATTVNLTQGLIGSNLSPTAPNSANAPQALFLFDRNAFAGVASKKFGNFTLGRHPTPVTESLWVTDPLKANNGATNLNGRLGYMFAPGAVTGGANIYTSFGPNSAINTNGTGLDRQSNSAKYVYTNSGVQLMAMYGLGGVTGDRSKNQYVGGSLGYDSDGAASHGPTDRALPNVKAAFSLRAAAQMFNDNGQIANFPAFSAANPNKFNVVSLYSWTVGGVGRYGPFKLKLSYTGNNVDNDSNAYRAVNTKIAAAGITYSIGDVDLTVAAYNASRTQNKGLTTAGGPGTLAAPVQDASKFYFVPEWYVTKNFWLYAIFDYEVYNAAGATAIGGLGGGAKSSFYGALGLSFFFNT